MHAFASRRVPDQAEVWPMDFDWSLGLQRPETKQARDYWLSRAENGRLPSRASLSPSDMRTYAAHVGLIEVLGPSGKVDYRIRLAGSKWEEVFGRMGGRLIGEFLPKNIEARWREVFDAVRQTARPLRVTTRLAFRPRAWLATEMFVAPLSEDATHVTMLLMCFTSWSTNAV